jgi:hypothetical protein
MSHSDDGSLDALQSCSKAWASGRVLTENQRKRKREIDRLRIRKRRQEHDEKVRILEEKLKNLTQSPLNEEIVKLQNDVARLQAENRSLRQQWEMDPPSGIEELTPPTSQSELMADSSSGATSPAPQDRIKRDPTLPCATLDEFLRANSSDMVKINRQRPAKNPLVDLRLQKSVPHGSLDAASAATAPPLTNNTVVKNPVQLATINLGGNEVSPWYITETCNFVAWSTRSLRDNDVCLDDATNQHMLILAMFEGWEAVESRFTLCPLWRILREVEYVVFSNTNTVERLVMLRMIHLMLLVRIARLLFTPILLFPHSITLSLADE